MSTRTKAERLQRTRREFERLAQLGLERNVLFRRAGDLLQQIVPFDGGCWHTLDPGTLLITSHWTNLSGEGFPMILENEYRHDDVAKFAELAGGGRPATALDAKRAPGSLRFVAYRSRGWGSELRASFDSGGETWGAVMLLRSTDVRPFTDADAAIVAALGRYLARAICASITAAAATAGTRGRSLVVLDGRNEVETATGELGARPQLHPALLSVAERARSATEPASARLHVEEGGWLVLHGALLDEAAGRVAVVVEPARPVEVAPLLASAYGLTPRERDVLRGVLHGRSTSEIAAALHVAPYTVQDHLKSIFEKTSTASRSELVARLFFEHFEPRLGDPLAFDGSFAS